VSSGHLGGQRTESRRCERDHAPDPREGAEVLSEALADSAAAALREHRAGQEPGHNGDYCCELEAEVADGRPGTVAGQRLEPAGAGEEEDAAPWPPRVLPWPVYAVSLDGEARQLPAGIEYDVVDLVDTNGTVEIATLTADPEVPVSFWYASERSLQGPAVRDEAQDLARRAVIEAELGEIAR
jgi:hypothetical protein